MSSRTAKKSPGEKGYLPFLIIGAALIVAIVGAFVWFRWHQAPGAPVAIVATEASPDPSSPAMAAGGNATQTATPAPDIATQNARVAVTVEEFGDYQCPPCGSLHPELKKIQREYGERVNFVFHNFPLATIHKNALVAAQAAEAARLQNTFWQMHDLLYENQNAWKDQDDPRPTFANYARQLGLDSKRFTSDMDGFEVQQIIAADQQKGRSAGVNGTPTIFIEGHELKPELTNPDGIRKGIQLMLGKKVDAH